MRKLQSASPGGGHMANARNAVAPKASAPKASAPKAASAKGARAAKGARVLRGVAASAAPGLPSGPAAGAKGGPSLAVSAVAKGGQAGALADDQPIRPVVTVAMKERAKAAESLTPSMKAAAKVQTTKRGVLKKGTVLPPVLLAVRKPKDVEWSKGPYGVFMDYNRFSCIRVSKSESVIEYIPMTAKTMDVHRMDAKRFDDRWKPYIYPLANAAEIYAEGAKVRGITEEARDHLGSILGRSLQLKTVSTEELNDMKAKEKAAKKAAAKVDAAEPTTEVVEETADKAKPKAEVTVTTVKNGKKTVTKTSKVPKPGDAESASKVKILSREDAAKLIKGGGKVKKGRDNDTRKGSLRACAIDAIQACATVEAALKATFKWKGAKQTVAFPDVRSAVRRGYVVIAKK